MTNYTLKRIYDEPSKQDGFRVLVDRLWPRGISKDKANLDLWEKEIAPSTELRKFFNHEESLYKEFKKRYLVELKNNKEEVDRFVKELKHHDEVTLLFGAKNTTMNQAVVLKDYLSKHK